MNTYIITGGEGFIGGKIRSKTSGLSYDLKSGDDILCVEPLSDAVRTADGIFHCAALISVPESFEKTDKYYRTNVLGTKTVADIASAYRKKIVFSSSAAVYGNKSTPVDESEQPNPQSPYAENKRDGELLISQSNTPSIALRYFNVYGPGQSPAYAGVITAFILKALRNEDIVIHGDGNQVRDFVYVDDIVSANIAAMEYGNDSFEVINVGSGVETTVLQLAKTIIALTGSSSRITHEPSRIGDIFYSQADITKAKTLLDWEPKVSLEEGLQKTIAFYRSQV